MCPKVGEKPKRDAFLGLGMLEMLHKLIVITSLL